MLYGFPNTDKTRLFAVQSQIGYDATHPDAQALWVEVKDGTVAGATSADGGVTWTNPPASAPEPDAYVVDVPSFKMRFTPGELVKIRASTDELVKVFLAEVVDDPRTARVNLQLPFVQGAVGYLAGEVDLGDGKLASPLIDPARVAAILAPAA